MADFDNVVEMRSCTTCKERKSVDLFHRDTSPRKGGYHQECKQCVSLRGKRRRMVK